jgi:hypothetical protein
VPPFEPNLMLGSIMKTKSPAKIGSPPGRSAISSKRAARAGQGGKRLRHGHNASVVLIRHCLGPQPLPENLLCGRSRIKPGGALTALLLRRVYTWDKEVNWIQYCRILIQIREGSIAANECCNDLTIDVSELIEIALLLEKTQ